jgi:uncharacterized membrane protein
MHGAEVSILLLLALILFGLPIASLIALAIVSRRLRDRLAALERRIADLDSGPALRAPEPHPAPPATARAAPPPRPPTPPPPGPSARPPSEAPIFRSAGVAPPASPRASGPPGESLERRIGTRWMVWVGAVILVFGIAYFVRYAFENRWIGETGRVVLGLLSGLAMIGAGEWGRRRGHRYLSQGLAGGGIAALYVSLYAASSLYHLIGIAAAFVPMAGVIAAGMALAVLMDALAVGILSLLGGFLTPVLLSTGKDSAEVLFAYLALLDLGVLGAALYRRWRSLDVLAYAGTMILYAGWFASYYRPERMGVALAGLLGFFVLFLLIPAMPVLRGRAAAAPEAVVLPAVAGITSFGFAYRILFRDHPGSLAFLTLGIAAAFVGIGAVLKRRAPSEGRLISGHIALAAAFLTLAIPIKLGLQGITLAWAVEGPLLILLGFRFGEPLLRLAGTGALVLAVGRVFVRHLPLHRDLFRPVFNAQFGTVLFVGAALFAAAWIWRRRSDAPDRGRATPFFGTAGGLLLLFLLATEAQTWCDLAGRALGEPGSYRAAARAFRLVLGGSAGVLFLGAGLLKSEKLYRAAGAVLLFVAGVLCLNGPWFEPVYAEGALRVGTAGWLVLNRGFLASLFVVACFVAAARLFRVWPLREEDAERRLPAVFTGASLALLWLLLTFEVFRFFSTGAPVAEGARRTWVAQMAVTLTWTLFAVALLVAGFLTRQAPLRYAAFGLLGLSVAKVVLFDMSEVRQIYRVISFIALGVVLVGVSYLYSRIARRAETGGWE